MFVFCNPCACTELHQPKRARKLCSATLIEVQLYIDTSETPYYVSASVGLKMALLVKITQIKLFFKTSGWFVNQGKCHWQLVLIVCLNFCCCVREVQKKDVYESLLQESLFCVKEALVVSFFASNISTHITERLAHREFTSLLIQHFMDPPAYKRKKKTH